MSNVMKGQNLLVISHSTADYFNQVQDWAGNHNLFEVFQMSMLSAHLYGCDWIDQEKVQTILSKIDKFNSFGVEVNTKDGCGLYRGELVYQGPKDSAEVLDTLKQIPYIEIPSRLGWKLCLEPIGGENG